jgi:amino acid transporter
VADLVVSAVPLSISPSTAAVCLVLVATGVHLVPRVVVAVQLVVVAVLVVFLAALVVPSLSVVVLGNFVPLRPTTVLQAAPVSALARATALATFALFGFDTVAAASSASRTPERVGPMAVLVTSLGVGVALAFAAFVTLGVIPWTRLVFAQTPLADAAASVLPVPVATLESAWVSLAASSAFLALFWAPSRLLAGLDELLPSLGHTNRFGAPIVALGVTGAATSALLLTDTVQYALFVTLTGLAILYATHAFTAALLPFLNRRLYDEAAFRPPRPALLLAGLVGTVAMLAVCWLTLTLDPIETLRLSPHGPTLSVFVADELLRSPTTSVVPALLGWYTLGIAVYLVARDYRDSTGKTLSPLRAGDFDGTADESGDDASAEEHRNQQARTN